MGVVVLVFDPSQLDMAELVVARALCVQSVEGLMLVVQ